MSAAKHGTATVPGKPTQCQLSMPSPSRVEKCPHIAAQRKITAASTVKTPVKLTI